MIDLGAKPELLLTGADMAEFERATGCSAAQVRWTVGRVRELRRQGLPEEARVRQIVEEGRSKPWLRQ